MFSLDFVKSVETMQTTPIQAGHHGLMNQQNYMIYKKHR